ncbi:Hypothetical predicted protein [Cloeon dipterum]|uniref:Uncharacterized protein n=1 Tax=Cloeon dipterum TaxID=197152 RepID=A0A8S1C7J8_9INSE|nr:Hypothetical predicted protein [Cloeon dipterum]
MHVQLKSRPIFNAIRGILVCSYFKWAWCCSSPAVCSSNKRQSKREKRAALGSGLVLAGGALEADARGPVLMLLPPPPPLLPAVHRLFSAGHGSLRPPRHQQPPPPVWQKCEQNEKKNYLALDNGCSSSLGLVLYLQNNTRS